MSRIKFLNTEIDNLTMMETVSEIKALIEARKPSYVVTPNVDHIIKLEEDNKLKEIYKEASLILADGKPLIWISKLYKKPLKEKVSGSDLFPKVCSMAAKEKYSLFFLGAAEGVAAKAAENLCEKFKGLNVIGTHSPSYGFEKDPEEINRIIEMIKAKKPDILIVGLGCPKQEQFIFDHYQEYQVPVSLGLGASLDFEAGNIKRAPSWMSEHGLEWFYRLVKEPRRLFKRYIIDDMKIFYLTFKYRHQVGSN